MPRSIISYSTCLVKLFGHICQILAENGGLWHRSFMRKAYPERCRVQTLQPASSAA